jgi:CubicO group peptidase (beta-lactamase class C family)
MTSGIQDNPTDDPVVTQLNEMSKTLLFAPGTKYDYSNVNFCLLAAMIQEQSGSVFGKPQSYSEFISSRILKPLGMTQTTQLRGTAATGPNSATPYKPYSSTNGCEEIPSSELQPGQSLVGAGDIVSTARDVSLYLKGLLNGRLLTRSTYRTFWDPTPVIGYPYGAYEGEPCLATPGLGWDNSMWTSKGPALVEKNGSPIGFQSQLTPPQGGWQVYVDVDSDGTDDYGDPATTTGSSGALALNDIPAGTR